MRLTAATPQIPRTRGKRIGSATTVPAAPDETTVRRRLAAWGRFGFVKMRQMNPTQMAKAMGFSQSGLRRILIGELAPGLDFAYKLASFANISLDLMIYQDPPAEYLDEQIPPPPQDLADKARRSKKKKE